MDDTSNNPSTVDLLLPPPPFLPPDQSTRNKYKSQEFTIEAYLLGGFITFGIIVILGWKRLHGGFVPKMAATIIFIPLGSVMLSYVPALMNQSPYRNDLFPLWMSFFVYLAATAHKFYCYSLSNNEDRRTKLLVDYLVPWGVIILSLYKKLIQPQVLVPVMLIFWIIIHKLRERREALSSATRSSCLGIVRTTKVVFDFMVWHRKENNDRSVEDPEGSSCQDKYLISVRGVRQRWLKECSKDEWPSHSDMKEIFKPEEVVTLDKLLQPNINDSAEPLKKKKKSNDPSLDNLMRSGGHGKNNLRHTCISFAMFWVLLTKIAGYSVDAKITSWFLPEDADDDSQVDKTFQLIEVELSFLHEYLYTNYYAVYSRGLYKKVRDLFIVVLFLWLAWPLLVEYRPQDKSDVYVVVGSSIKNGFILDTIITRFVIVAIFLMELIDLAFAFTCKWAKMTYICAYFQKVDRSNIRTRCSWFMEKMIRLVCSIPHVDPEYWWSSITKLPQYSLLQCYDKTPILKLFEVYVSGYVDVPRTGQAGHINCKLSIHVKKAIINYVNSSQIIDNTAGPTAAKSMMISNGVESLRKNDRRCEFIKKYVCELESPAHMILVWHLATSWIEKLPVSYRNYSSSHDVATQLSNYCAYLVAIAPKFIPTNIYITQCAFDRVVKELMSCKRKGSPDHFRQGQKLETEHSIILPDNTLSILQRASGLVEDIKDDPLVWKILADFWTELVLYLAISGNDEEIITSHMDQLCSGSEFMTHLWVLVNHAGFSRDPDAMPPNEKHVTNIFR